ncbi:MAG: hypothetical protein HOL70_00605 [Candidatus Marinimicrobia bacterium]|nr:hypothetical protein [Candidatus Neomarinimicrobiota bacterium]
MEIEAEVVNVVKDPAQDKALVLQYFKEIDEINKINDDENGIYSKIKKNRQYIKGEQFKEDDVKTNLVNSTLQSLIPHVYAKSPEIAVDVNEKLASNPESGMYEGDGKKNLAKTLEIVLNQQFNEANTKHIFKNAVRSSKVCSIGWVKVHLQNVTGPNPKATTALADTRDNLHMAHGIEKELEADENNELQKARLEQIEEGLLNTPEIVLSKGLVIDNIDFEDVFVSPSVGRFSDLHKAGRIFQRIWKSKSELMGEFPDANWSGVSTHEWGKDKKDNDYNSIADSNLNNSVGNNTLKGNENQKPVAVYEVWDKDQNRVHLIVKGIETPLLSWTPENVGEQWYPFFGLAFNQLEDEFQPLTDLEQWLPLQDEYTDTRTKLKKHREMNKPHYVANGLKEGDIKKFTVSETAEILAIDTEGRPIDQALQKGVHIPIDPKSYDTTQIMRDLQIVSGLQEADMGSVVKAKTATEASIMNNGRATRVSEQRDTLEDFISAIANYTAECFLLGCDVGMVKEIAGEGATWYDDSYMPNCSIKQKADKIYNYCNVSVRAGSTGKPDEMEDRSTWIELLPVLQNLAMQIAQGQAQNMDVSYLEEYLKETLERFGIDGDSSKFIPQMQAPQQQQMQMPMGMPQGMPQQMPQI